MKVFLIITAVVILIYGFHRMALGMEEKGWIFYINREPSPGSVGNALLEVQQLIEPQKASLLEVRLAEEEEVDEWGEPPDP